MSSRFGKNQNEDLVGIPYLLDFDGPGKFKIGRGRAGYTVMHVPRSQVKQFLVSLPEMSWMPGTYRLAKEFGVK